MTEETNETKIVVTHKGDKASVGIQRTDCDPVFFTVVGDLPAVIIDLPKCLADADGIWQKSPRYRKAEVPAPPPSTMPARTATTSSTKQAPKTSTSKPAETRNAMF